MTTDYIHTRVEISGRYFINTICGGGNKIKVLTNKCVYVNRDFYKKLGTGKSFFMNCSEFQILFIHNIHLLTHSSSFCVQVKVILLIIKTNTYISTSIETILIHLGYSKIIKR